jgi:transposase
MARSRVELFEQIRRDRRVEGASIRELADPHRVHRRTVRQALDSAVPPRKSYPQRPRPAIDAFAAVIDGWLLADKEVPRKQRHTARRVWQRLVAGHDAALSEVTVSRYVARRRAELGLDRAEVSVPQLHLPGAEAEVGFGEFHAMIAGTLLKVWLFVLRLSCSGRAFHVAFATQAQEAFLEGHVLAFEHLGGVPGRIRHDNLRPAALSCCSRSSPNARKELPSRSRQICRSANGEPCSPTPASSPPSSTASPSTRTSSRPAPSPAGSPRARQPSGASRTPEPKEQSARACSG